MIRPFDIRDVSVVQRLTALARPLACELVAVDGVSPLRDAMRAYMSGGRDHAVVLVERDNAHEVDAFGLMYVLPDISESDGHPSQRRAGLIMMAPHAQTEALVEAWMYLAQEFASEAAQRGVHHIVAEVPESGGEAEALHGAGFVPLVQQDVLKLALKLDLDPASATEVPGMRELIKDDEPLIRALHLRTAPKITYQAEVSFDMSRATHRMDRGYVLIRANELMAHVSVRNGKRGYGMHVQFRPEVEADAKSMLEYALSHLLQKHPKPVYVTIRHYQSWLLPIFDELGFTHMTSTMLMVRHTAARITHPVWSNGLSPLAVKRPTSASITMDHIQSQYSKDE
jgi:hypothetical protein